MEALSANEQNGVKRKRLSEETQKIIEDKQESIARTISQRERDLRELLFLESGGNILDLNETSPSLVAALDTYHESHKIISPKTKHIKQETSSNTKLKPFYEGTKLLEAVLQSPTAIKLLVKTASYTPSQTQKTSSLNKVETSEDIAARASKDSEILKRISELQREGLWSAKRIPKVPEPPRNKVHWDFLLAEMVWLSNDFREERKFKTAVAKKLASKIAKRRIETEAQDEKKEKEQELQIRSVAKMIASEVKKFWMQIEKLVEYKQQLRLE